jgi:hypothetical protein
MKSKKPGAGFHTVDKWSSRAVEVKIAQRLISEMCLKHYTVEYSFLLWWTHRLQQLVTVGYMAILY